MSKITLDTTDMTAIGNAIRTKLAVETPYKPGEMPAAILSIPGGGVTPTGTISIDSNGTYDVTQYASATVNVASGGSIDLSYLPNSVAANVIASQDADTLDLTAVGNKWGDLAIINQPESTSRLQIVDNAVRINADQNCVFDTGGVNIDVTAYLCFRFTTAEYSGNPPALNMYYGFSTGNVPNFNKQANKTIYASVYTGDTYAGSAADFIVVAIALNQTTKQAKFYVNAQLNATKSFGNSGRYIGIGTCYVHATSRTAVDAKYFGAVLACESDETIIANMQTIMTKCGVSA